MLCEHSQLPLTAGLLSYKTSECSRARHWSKLNFGSFENPVSYCEKGSSAQIVRDGQITRGLENQYNFGLLKLGTFYKKEGHYFLSELEKLHSVPKKKLVNHRLIKGRVRDGLH